MQGLHSKTSPTGLQQESSGKGLVRLEKLVAGSKVTERVRKPRASNRKAHGQGCTLNRPCLGCMTVVSWIF